MKKIILSLAMIAAVSAMTYGITTAYFSDTETSTGNTFTAGMIDLQIDSECSYNGWECMEDGTGTDINTWHYKDVDGNWTSNGMECACNWDLKDLTKDARDPDTLALVKGDRFFDFGDIKPGDYGENTISFHGASNDAYLYATLIAVSDRDVTCVDPEKEAEGEGVCIEDGNTGDEGSGELDEEIFFFMWKDDGDACAKVAGDNIYDPACGDKFLAKGYAGTASTFINQKIYLGDLPAGNTTYVGVAWCVGAPFVPGNTGEIICNGEPVGNEAQTDTFVVGVEFESVQKRHNTINPDATVVPVPTP